MPGSPTSAERPRHALGDLGFAHLLVEVLVQPVGDVGADRDRVEERRALEQHADALAHLAELARPSSWRCLRRGRGSARVDLEQADQHLEHDALADARAADDGQRLARANIEIEPVVDDLGPEPLTTFRNWMIGWLLGGRPSEDGMCGSLP